MIALEAFPKKSLIVKLPVDFSRSNTKRKQSPTSSTTSAPRKKQKKTASTAPEPDKHQLEEEVQKLTVQWMRQIYQDPAMSHPGFKDAHTVEDNGDHSDSSELSDPPDSAEMDLDD